MASFPFVEPPDPRQISDGITVLEELGALDRRTGSGPVTLTETGRALAALPVDPRLARMIVEADRLGCLREVLVITAALAIQDVREYPLDDRDTGHRRRTPGSSTRTRTSSPCSTCGSTWPTRGNLCPATPSAGCASGSTCTTCGSGSGRTCTGSCPRSLAGSVWRWVGARGPETGRGPAQRTSRPRASRPRAGRRCARPARRPRPAVVPSGGEGRGRRRSRPQRTGPRRRPAGATRLRPTLPQPTCHSPPRPRSRARARSRCRSTPSGCTPRCWPACSPTSD